MKIDGDDLCIWKSFGKGTPSFSWKSVTLMKAALTDMSAYFLSSFKMSVSVAMSEVTWSGESESNLGKVFKGRARICLLVFWGNGEIFCSFSGPVGSKESNEAEMLSINFQRQILGQLFVESDSTKCY